MPDGKQITEPMGIAKYDFTADFKAKKMTVRSADIPPRPQNQLERNSHSVRQQIRCTD
jgi:hypothetical protein